jgi:asparagine synthase (glutamine-hydrolysing)
LCGICGIINTDTNRKVDGNLIERMCSVLSHRGPDDAGIYLKDNMGFGHRRLSVLDVTRAGHQPMTNEDRTIWLVFNGEIYNYCELRKELENKGHIFSSSSDTETIIHLYEEKGIECLQDLRGMFAFALWDAKEKSLFLARDRLGKKPLVYSHNNNRFLFASELKALLFDQEVSREINTTAIQNYLTYGYIASPQTIFSDIKKLPPAHYLILKEGSIKIKKYWDLSYQKKLVYGSSNEYRDHFLELFYESVKLRLRSDVSFGAFLSGGIDSSIIVAVMSKNS